ncbi:MAG: Ig-like domain-containing protein [Gemmataceae bacterium]
MRHLINRIARSLRSDTPSRPQRSRRARLGIEALEDRAVPTTFISPNGWHTASVTQEGPYFRVSCVSKGPSTLNFIPIGGPVLEASAGPTTNVVSQPQFSSDSTRLTFTLATGPNAVQQFVVPLDNPTSISVAAPGSSVYGQAVALRATVTVPPATAAPTYGLVSFFVDGNLFGYASLAGSNTATLYTSQLPGGSHSITAAYQYNVSSRPPGYYPSQMSAPVGQAVSPAASATSLAESMTSSVYGQAVAFTATVKAVTPGIGTPAGVVSFFDAGNFVGSAGLNAAGQAVFNTASLPSAAHAISARYDGSADFAFSQSGPVGQTVFQAGTSTAVASSANPSVFGQAVTYTASVKALYPSSATPAGSVTFYIDGLAQAPVALNSSGQAALTLSSLGVGVHSVVTSYGGNGNFIGSQSGLLPQGVNKAGTTTAIAASSTTSTFGQTVTFTAIVSAAAPASGVPAGTVRFFLDGQAYSDVPVNGAGQAGLALSNLSAGAHTVKAAYLGDSPSYLASQSPVAGEVVALSLGSPTLPAVTAGTPYNMSIAARGGSGTYTYSLLAGQQLPPGCVLDPNQGTLSGTTKVAKTYTFAIKATDAVNPSVTGVQTFSFTVKPAVAALTVSAPATATAGVGFYFTVTSKDQFGNVVDGPVQLSSSDGQAAFPAGVGLVNGTLTTWAVLKTAGPETIRVGLGGISGTSGSIAVSPNGLAKFAVTAPATATAGVAFPVSIVAKDAFGNSIPSFNNKIALVSSDGQPVTPNNVTLVNGAATVNVTLNLARTVNFVAAYGQAVGFSPVTVNPAAVASVAVYYLGGVGAGTALGVTVVAKDQFGNGIAAPVTLTSSDGQPVTFNPVSVNPGNIVGQAFLTRAGKVKLTAKVGAVSGTGIDLIVYPAAINSFVVGVPATAKVGVAFTITVTAKDKYGNTIAGFGAPLAVTSSDGKPVTVLGGAWGPNGVASMTVKLNAPGTVTLNVAYGTISGTSVPLSVQA